MLERISRYPRLSSGYRPWDTDGPGRSALLSLLLLAPSLLLAQGDDLLRLPPEDLELIEFDLSRGQVRTVLADLDELVEELPADVLVRSLRARARFRACDYDGALEDARGAWQAARTSESPRALELAEVTRTLATLLVELGRTGEALEALESAEAAIRPGEDPRDAWVLARARAEAGQREVALELLRAGAEAPNAPGWGALLAQARCQRARGDIRGAAATLVAADQLAASGHGTSPDVLVELGHAYFEAYGEVDEELSLARSPANLYREALRLDPEHEGARLGLVALCRFNWRRTRENPTDLLQEVFRARPDSIEGLLARVSLAIDDGNLKSARDDLARLDDLAPSRRDVRTQRASLAWIEHDRESARELLDELSRGATAGTGDSRPEREVGKHLIELYRFGEALPFLERAVELDPRDWNAWTLLGRAQANTGDEEAAFASLQHAEEVAGGRRDAWRANTLLVLKHMRDGMVPHEAQELSFLWHPDAAPVLERYLVPFYAGAREELSARYGHTPGPTKIEVFRSWEDFSVRSTGFQGYPALGVCFGPVVTAVSPLSELRGTFSWARTSYHEFTHVVHLGLSHNRCPRWITEGLATWEEGVKSNAWWRNMRREMLDARANGAIIPIRRLNAAFRGSRVVFAYYQSGLLSKLLIERHGFPPMVQLLEAFDAGADLDQALADVFGATPEQLDADFLAFVDGELGELAIEPRWSSGTTFRRRFRLSRTAPAAAEERRVWQEEWCRVAWGSYWGRELVDAEEALRIAGLGGELPARGLFLRGELLLARGEREQALVALRRGFERGGEDFRARMAYAALLIQEGETDAAEEHFLAAERAFPGYDDERFSAELRLAALYDAEDRGDEANEARLRWLAFNAGNYDVRLLVGEWLLGKGRHAEAARVLEEANQVDPFRRHLHLVWGRALSALGRHEEALREYEVGLLVPEDLDGDLLIARGLAAHAVTESDPLEQALGEEAPEELPGGALVARWRAEESRLLGRMAETLLELERPEDARAAAERALELDPDCEPALAVEQRLEGR